MCLCGKVVVLPPPFTACSCSVVQRCATDVLSHENLELVCIFTFDFREAAVHKEIYHLLLCSIVSSFQMWTAVRNG